MKARVKETGKIVDICADSLAGFLAPEEGIYYKEEELSTELGDWSSFRREAAKDILCSVLAGGVANGAKGFDAQKEELVNVSIDVADELIKQLREQ